MAISSITHPTYDANIKDWQKWRLVYEGGSKFIEEYVEKFSDRENATNFTNRKKITYSPAFAKASVNEVKNSIFQRIADVTREGGPVTYMESVLGRLGGVDLNGATMDTFIGSQVLGELLSMAKVGVYIDMPVLKEGTTLADKGNIHPYLYVYHAEDILSWTFDGPNNPTQLKTLLLKETVYELDDETQLPEDTTTRFRYLRLEDDGVHVQFFDENDVEIDASGEPGTEQLLLLPRIPFVILEISDSLLADTADHQIALLNLGSSDINYSMKSNFPFYTEQYDPRLMSNFVKPSDSIGDGEAKTDGYDKEITVGSVDGRKYPKDMERPAFINPSPDPLRVSMEKQGQLKDEIRTLINLNLSNVQSKMASAESKSLDLSGLEAGLSNIGLELAHGERQIAAIWSMYEGTKEPTTIIYPKRYSLQSEEDRRKEAKDKAERMKEVPSLVFQKVMAKDIANILVGSKVSAEILGIIHDEIDAASTVIVDPDVIIQDVENGLVDKATASALRMYPKGSVVKAEEEHCARLKRIQDAQGEGARGVPDTDGDPKASTKGEKEVAKETDTDDIVKDKTRGGANG